MKDKVKIFFFQIVVSFFEGEGKENIESESTCQTKPCILTETNKYSELDDQNDSDCEQDILATCDMIHLSV